jgi:hypothetical protein
VLVYRLLISPQPAKLRWLHYPPLDAVLATPKLIQRLSRTPDFESESRFLGILAQTLAGSPRSILQKLADETLALCSAHSAGISMLESDRGEPVIRWRALAGALAPHRWASETIGRCVGATVAEIIARSLETVRPLVANRNHTLLVDVRPEPVFLEAMSCGCLRRCGTSSPMLPRTPTRAVGINAQRNAIEVVITVSDSGIGIALAELEAIFEL